MSTHYVSLATTDCTFTVELCAERRVHFYVIVAHADVASPLHTHAALARDVNVAARPVGASPRVRVTSLAAAGVDLHIKDKLTSRRRSIELESHLNEGRAIRAATTASLGATTHRPLPLPQRLDPARRRARRPLGEGRKLAVARTRHVALLRQTRVQVAVPSGEATSGCTERQRHGYVVDVTSALDGAVAHALKE